MPSHPSELGRFMEEGPLCVCGNLRKATRAVTQLYDEAFRSTGLHATQVALLGACGMLNGAMMGSLADLMVMDRTTLTRNLRPLEKDGLIRITTGKDRREREVAITKKGQELLLEVYPLWKRVQSRVANALGQERMGRLLSDLSLVVGIAQVR